MRHILILVMVHLASSAAAGPDCDVVGELVWLQGTALRLSAAPPVAPSPTDLALLRAGLARINPAQVPTALGDTLTASDRSEVTRFVQRVADLDPLMGAADGMALAAALQQPDLQALLGRVGPILDRLDCKSTGQAAAQTRARPGPSSGIGTVGPILGRTSLFGLTALSMVLCGSALVYHMVGRRVERRTLMGTRHPLYLNALVRPPRADEADSHPVTLLDISCRGAKLRWDSPVAAVGDHILLWLDDRWVGGAIQWRTAFCVGLRLDPGLSLGQVARLVALNASAAHATDPVAGHRRPEPTALSLK